jgi:NAD(P)-dependent dehydrogenase (short-subunit alcohol dehydrogenase family)
MTQTPATQPDTEPETKTALITGGGSGIGRAAAIARAAEGYEVTIASRTAATLEETVNLVTQPGAKAKYVIADVHDEDASAIPSSSLPLAAPTMVAASTSRLTAPVSTAATTRTRSSTTRREPRPHAGHQRARHVLLDEARTEIMARQGFGSIVNISSGAGLTTVPGYVGYVASKHAEIGLTNSAALDYADRGVRVNAVCPGLVNTPLIADMVTENPEMHEHLVCIPPARPHRRARGNRRLNRLAGQQQSPATSPASRCPWTAATARADSRRVVESARDSRRSIT